MIGKTFLRLERDFDKHVNYCRDESNAQEFLFNNDEVREFFEVSGRSREKLFTEMFVQKFSLRETFSLREEFSQLEKLSENFHRRSRHLMKDQRI